MRADLPPDLFTSCLSPTDSSTPIRFATALAKAAPGAHVLGCKPVDFEAYERLGHCRTTLLSSPLPVRMSKWGGPDRDRILTSTPSGVWEVEWRGHTLVLVAAEWQDGWKERSQQWLVAETEECAKELLLDVARVTNDPRDAILVFHGGCWQQSKELYAMTERSSFDDLILARELKEQIRADFRRFLQAREAYERVGLAWRRGALFVGPPGNGKTHCLRALVKELAVPSLYVQSLKHRYETEEANLKQVFERARQLRPCVLVLEDIDALINAENRSFFLNQLDGFEKNVGLIVLATTNHPEKIDSAILDRPSRFDRKYHFALPELGERRAYLTMWQRRLAPETGWDDSLTDDLATATGGFSFAYLKELITSALQRSVADEGEFATLAREESRLLQSQRQTASSAKTVEKPEDGMEGMMERAVRRMFAG